MNKKTNPLSMYSLLVLLFVSYVGWSQTTNNSSDYLIAKLRKQIEQLNDENFLLQSTLQSKLLNLKTLEQKAKEAQNAAVEKVSSSETETTALKAEIERLKTLNQRLEQEILNKNAVVDTKDGESKQEIERLRAKLAWVYKNYKLKRKN